MTNDTVVPVPEPSVTEATGAAMPYTGAPAAATGWRAGARRSTDGRAEAEGIRLEVMMGRPWAVFLGTGID